MLKKYNKIEKSWIMYDVANSAFTLIIITTIMPIFFKDIASRGVDNAVSTSYWGFANSTASIILAFLAPLIGSFADIKGKKMKFFAMFFSFGMVFTLALLSLKEGDWVMCIIFFVAARVGWSGANLFYDSFLTDVTTNEKMDDVSASGFGWGYIGSVIPFLAIIAIVFMWKTPNQTGAVSLNAAKASFFIVALWWGLFSIPFFRNVRQKYYIEQNGNYVKESFARLFNTFREISKYKNIAIFLAAYFFYIDGVGTIISMAAVYGRDIGLSATLLISAILLIQIIAFPSSILFGKLAKKTSAKTMIYTGIVIYSIITVLGFIISDIQNTAIQTGIFWLMAVMVASAQGGIQSLSRSLYAKLIPKEKSSEFFGFFNIFGKFAAILGPALMGGIGLIFGNSRYGILSIFFLFLAGGIILKFVKEPE